MADAHILDNIPTASAVWNALAYGSRDAPLVKWMHLDATMAPKGCLVVLWPSTDG